MCLNLGWLVGLDEQNYFGGKGYLTHSWAFKRVSSIAVGLTTKQERQRKPVFHLMRFFPVLLSFSSFWVVSGYWEGGIALFGTRQLQNAVLLSSATNCASV